MIGATDEKVTDNLTSTSLQALTALPTISVLSPRKEVAQARYASLIQRRVCGGRSMRS